MAWNPAHSIIKRLGGEVAVAEATKLALTAPYRWQAGTDKGGSGGKIPQKRIPILIEFAKSKDIDLRLEDFFAEPSLVDEVREVAQ
jgi:hypothetical protein